MNDLVTIGIPIYNVEKYVERALLSALNQTYPYIEYILVDDKGTDRSMEIVEKIAKTHPRGSEIKIIDHVINRSQGVTRNTCIDIATGKYLFFMDSDDEITPDCIEVLYHEAMRTNADVVGASMEHIFKNQTVLERWTDRVWQGKEQVILSFFGQIPSYNTNNLYNLSFLKENKLRIDVNTIEDITFSFRIVLKATTIAAISKITYKYYKNEDGVTAGGNWNEKIYKSWMDVFREEKKLMEETALPEALKIKVEKKLFAQRLIIANYALKSKYNVQHYIQDYLSPEFIGKNRWKNITLLAFYLFSKMPLWVKKMCIPLLIKVKNNIKKE